MSLIVTLQTPPQHIKKRLCILLNSLLLKIECVGNFFIVLQFTGGGRRRSAFFQKNFIQLYCFVLKLQSVLQWLNFFRPSQSSIRKKFMVLTWYTGCIKKKFTVGKFSLNKRARNFGENFPLAEYV